MAAFPRNDPPFEAQRDFFRDLITGNGMFRARTLPFNSAIATFNLLGWHDPDPLYRRVWRSGCIYTDRGIMLVNPRVVASFFGLSVTFVAKHLEACGWRLGDISRDDASQIEAIFPSPIASGFLRTKGVQVRFWQRPQGNSSSTDGRNGERSEEDFADPSTLTDQDCANQVLSHAAKALSETPEVQDLDQTLDDTLSLIDSLLDDPLDGSSEEDRSDQNATEPVSCPPDARIPLLQSALATLKKQMREVKASRRGIQLELARTWRIVHRQNREIADLKTESPAKPSLAPEPAPPAPEPPVSIQEQFLGELVALAEKKPEARHFSDDMKSICYALYSLSPKAYRLAREILPLPSATTISSFMSDRKEATALALAGRSELNEYLQDYRRRLQITDEKFPCNLAFDATAASTTGVKLTKNKATQSCFSYLLLALDHRFPDLLIRSDVFVNGRIGLLALQMKDECLEALRENNFACHFVSSDGDGGMNPFHDEAFQKYANSDGVLRNIVNDLTDNGRVDLMEWPISDFLHLLKNARSRLAKSTLGLTGETLKHFTAASVAKDLKSKRMREILCADSALDLLKDHLALETFTLENLLKLWECGDATEAYFMLPFVCLNLGMRNPKMTVGTRQGLVQTGFSVFFDMATHYPATGQGQGIYEKCGPAGVKTFWTQTMLKRACNLCVGVCWALDKWGFSPDFWLALGRIGTHPVECHFGITRSTLNGRTDWDRFLQAQVAASLVHQIMQEFGLRAYIRRFKDAAGCTLDPDHRGPIIIDFDWIIPVIAEAFNMLSNNQEEELVSQDVTVITAFQALSRELISLKYVEKIKKASRLSGHAITDRLFFMRQPLLDED
jgi:hypothetical protein